MATKIVFSGYYGSGNTGDEAILAVLLNEFSKRINDFEPVIITASPAENSSVFEAKTVEKTDIKNIARLLWSADLLVSGGGSLLQDVTGKKTVPYYLGIMILARLFKVSVFFCAQGVGPLSSNIFKKITGMVLNRVDILSVRDDNSRTLLKDIGVNKKIHKTADMAYLLEPSSPGRIDKILAWMDIDVDKKQLIGVSVRPWNNNDYIDELNRFLALLQKDNESYQFVLLPFKSPEDIDLSREVIKRAENESVNIKMIEGNYTPQELLGLISRMEVLIGMRLHSLIFASLVKTLPLGITYDPKVDAFLEQLNLLPLGDIEKFDSRQFFEKASEYISNKQAIKKNLAAKNQLFRERAEKNINLAMQLLGDSHG